MNIVFLAAGKSSRIFKDIRRPKCLISLNKENLLQNLIDKTPKNSKVFIITGFKEKNIKSSIKKSNKIRFIFNRYYRSREMMDSINLALNKTRGDTIISYTDICYEKKIFRLFKHKNKKITLPVLENWKKIWNIRRKNIFKDAETLKIDIKKKNIINIGEKIKRKSVPTYQFMGINFNPQKSKKIFQYFYKIQKLKKKLHTTKFINLLIKSGIKVDFIPYKGSWYEFDDIEDIKNFKLNFKNFFK